MKFSRLQNQLKDKLDIEHLADIARELGVSPQAVSNWKSRDRVPYKYIVKIREILQDRAKIDKETTTRVNATDEEVSLSNNLQLNIEEDYITLPEILLILAKHFKIIVIMPIITCTLMIINVQFFTEDVYIAKAKIMSSIGSSNVSQAAGFAAQFGINLLPSNQSTKQWYLEDIIKSRTLAKIMLNRKFDTEKYGKKKSLFKILTNIDVNDTNNDIDLQSGINSVIAMITLTPSDNHYNLEVAASEPIFAKDFTIALIEELDEYQREYNNTQISETRQFIKERIKETEKDLNLAEEDLKNFRDRNRRIENSPSLLLEQQRLSREVSVLTGVYTTLKQQNETTKIEEVKESIYVTVLDPPIAPITRSKPKKKFMVTLSGIIGIAIGVSLAFLIYFFESRSAKEQQKLSQLKTIFIKNLKELFLIRKIIKRKL